MSCGAPTVVARCQGRVQIGLAWVLASFPLKKMPVACRKMLTRGVILWEKEISDVEKHGDTYDASLKECRRMG